jgi:HD-GYP domain-containing protein (c-di-GMP phosphodiesterase class II)
MIAERYAALHQTHVPQALPFSRQIIRVRIGSSFMQKAILHTLATVLSSKDETTAHHAQRVKIYACGIGRALNCSRIIMSQVGQTALLHDIGKIHIDDAILNKPGRLTTEEFTKMKAHTLLGGDLVGSLRFHPMLVAGVRSHHERWDGKGYPDGLKEDEIPFLARVIAVADTYDCCLSDRPYRKGLGASRSQEILREESGKQFDPSCVAAFFVVLPEMAEEVAHLSPYTPSYAEQLTDAALAAAPAAGYLEQEVA